MPPFDVRAQVQRISTSTFFDKERKRFAKSDLPVFRQRFAGIGDLSVDASALNVNAFIGYIPNTDRMDSGND